VSLIRVRLGPAAVSLLAGIALLLAGGPAPTTAAAAGDDITVSGNTFLRGGTVWAPKGVQIVGLLPGFPVPHQHWGAPEVQRLKQFGADLIRFQVAQPALARGDQNYLAEVRDAVTLARGSGLNVILSMQDESPSGEDNPLGMPTAATARAWTTLTPLLKSDLGIIGELFNEPKPQPNDVSWRIWANGGAFNGGTAIGHQQLITQLRNAGVRNVLIAEGLALGKSFASNPPTLNDPQHQLAFGTHPYFGPVNGTPDNNPAAWDANFGNYARTHPVLATEWDENSFGPPSCNAQIPGQATTLVNTYLPNHHIGLVGFAFDVINTLIKDWNYTLTTYNGFTCGKPGFGPGQLIHNEFIRN